MAKPAPYPPNDSQESKSINVLLDLLDEEWIKGIVSILVEI
jgi:hypothetical protein